MISRKWIWTLASVAVLGIVAIQFLGRAPSPIAGVSARRAFGARL